MGEYVLRDQVRLDMAGKVGPHDVAATEHPASRLEMPRGVRTCVVVCRVVILTIVLGERGMMDKCM